MRPDSVFLALGSNIGDRQRNLAAALSELKGALHLTAVSAIYETEPVGFSDQPAFLNLVCRAETILSPAGLHHLTLSTEHLLGRRETFRNGPRIIDIDILFYGDRVIETECLRIPHPGIPDRAFVLVPLAQIAPDFMHPTLHKTVSALLAETSDSHWVRLADGGTDVPVVR